MILYKYNALTGVLTPPTQAPIHGDNLVYRIDFDFTGTGFETAAKYINLRMADGTMDIASLGTDALVSFTLESKHLKRVGSQGITQFNPYCIVGEAVKSFPIRQIPIGETIPGSIANATTQEFVQTYIDGKTTAQDALIAGAIEAQDTLLANSINALDATLAVKAVNVTTLLSTEVASGSMTRAVDGLTLNLNIPAGAKIVSAGFDEDDLVFTLDDATTVRIVGAYSALVQTKESLGLANVDNTSDTDKPISTLQQAGLNLKQTKKYRFGFDEYGMFVKPSDFTPTLPCNFYRDSTNLIKNNMSFTQYTGGTKIYVNNSTGNDSTGNGLIGTPYKTLVKAMTIACAGGDASYNIVVLSDVPFMRDECFSTHTIQDKIIAITHNDPTKRIVMTTGNRGLSWTQDGTGTWKTTRTTVYSVYDFRAKDVNGVYIPLTNVASVVECQATPNTWYTDGTLVYVHTPDGLVPTESTISVNVLTGIPRPIIKGTGVLYLKDMDFMLMNNNGDGLYVAGDATGATVGGTFVADNCTFTSQGKSAQVADVSGSALALMNIKNTYLFNCKGAYACSDIFNYHFANVPVGNRRECLVLEYNCTAYNAGLSRTSQNNNTTTCHEGASIIRFGSIGYNALGPVLADVADCYSIMVDCDMRQTLSNVGTYQLDQTSTTGKAFVINCSTDSDAVGLNAHVETYVYDFVGVVSDTGHQKIMN